MGCDIHLAVEVRKGGTWERRLPPEEDRDLWLVEQASKGEGWAQRAASERWYGDRNYSVFAMLADVRNGSPVGGAGGYFEPLSEARGLPKDLCAELKKDRHENDGEGEREGFWLGDHSFSHVTLAGLEGYTWRRKVERTGVISFEQFKKRQEAGETGRPQEYCGAIMGRGIITIDEGNASLRMMQGIGHIIKPETPDEKLHVQITWRETYAECAGGFYTKFIPALRRLAKREGVSGDYVRIVFGFDS